MKKITSILALFLMCFGISLQAAVQQPELTTDVNHPKWYTVKSYRSGKFMSLNGDISISQKTAISDSTLWYFVASGDGVALVNSVTGNKLTTDLAFSEEGSVWYLTSNDNNKHAGLSISKTNPISGGSCLDASNASDNIACGWDPRPGDWEGTTWLIESCTEHIAAAVASMDSKNLGSVAFNADKKAAWSKMVDVDNVSADEFLTFVKEKEALGTKKPVVGKSYLVRCAFPGYMEKQGVEKAWYWYDKEGSVEPGWGTLNDVEKKFYWVIEEGTQKGTFVMKNLDLNKYLKDLGSFSENKADAAVVAFNEVGQEQLNIQVTSTSADGKEQKGNAHTGGHGGGNGVSGALVLFGDGLSNASSWYVTESAFTASADVKYDYYLDGKVVYTETVKQKVGNKYACSKRNTSFVSFVVEDGVVAEGANTVNVTCTENLPFVKSKDEATATWYAVDMHNRNIYWNGTAAADMVKLDKVDDDQLLLDAKYLWCFSGNAISGFKIINKAKGFGLALDGANPAKLVEFGKAYSFLLKGNTSNVKGGVCFEKEGNKYLNHDAGKQCVGEWGNNDAGSACRFYSAQEIASRPIIAASNELLAEANELLFVGQLGAVGSSLYFAEAANLNSFAAAVTELESNKADEKLLHSLQNQVDKAKSVKERVALVPGSLYRFQNVQRNLAINNGDNTGNGGFMGDNLLGETVLKDIAGKDSVRYQAISCHGNDMGDGSYIWCVEAVNDSLFKIKNLNTGLYIGKTDSVSGSWVTQVKAAEAGLYKISELDSTAQFNFVCTNGIAHKEPAKQGSNLLHASSPKTSGEGIQNYVGGKNSASAWYLIPAKTLEVSMTEGYATVYLPFGVKLDNDVKAYTGKVNAEKTSVYLTEVAADKNLPANSPVILNSSAAKAVLTIDAANEAAALTSELVGSKYVKSLVEKAEGEGKEDVRHNTEYLVVGNGASGIGMYAPKGNVLKAGKVYMVAPTVDAAVNGLAFIFGEATGVENVEVAAPANNVYYDLSGRRVANPVKGVYILNGKKVYVK